MIIYTDKTIKHVFPDYVVYIHGAPDPVDLIESSPHRMCAFITPVYAGKAHTYCCLCGAPFTVLSYGSPNYDWLRRMSTLQIRIDSRFISALDNRYILPIQKNKTPVFPSLTCHDTHRNSKINDDVAFQMDFRFLISNFHYYDNNDGGHSFPFHESCRKIFCQALSTHKYVSSLA